MSINHSSLKIVGIGILAVTCMLFLAMATRWMQGSGVLAVMLFLVPVGAFVLFVGKFLSHPSGVDNDKIHQDDMTFRGLPAYLVALFFTLFYVVLYLGDKIILGGVNVHAFMMRHVYFILDPLSHLLRGTKSDNWFFYGTLYTGAVLIFGVRMLLKYRHSPYQVIRTISVMFFQLAFAYIIPAVLIQLNQPEYYFSYFWPLKPETLYPYSVMSAIQSGAGQWVFWFMIFSAFMIFVATPILTYFFGKRWYCSFVCGCGGLAETMGDPYRHLSDKSTRAWKLEKVLIHSILGVIILVTIFLWVNSLSGGKVFGKFSQTLSSAYGLYIGAIFSGVIGVGFYPLLGSRVWCRFGCPMAAILGIQQRLFSRFRITTNGGQCISCGNCSTYCEMGIDVKSYAQRGENIVRASCVGCGICSSVCPRGVLKLENGPVKNRFTI